MELILWIRIDPLLLVYMIEQEERKEGRFFFDLGWGGDVVVIGIR